MKWISHLLSICLFLVPSIAYSVDGPGESFPPAGDESDKYQTDVIVEGLDNPSGLAIRPFPEQGRPTEIFFAESGAGVVRKFSADDPKSVTPVVTGLETRQLSNVDDLRVGPWSLGFVTPTKLAVLGGVKGKSPDQVGVFSALGDAKALTADQLDHTAALSDDAESKDLAEFPAMTFGETTSYMAVGSSSRGVILKALLVANRIDSPQRLTSQKEGDTAIWPTALCLSPSKKTQYLVAGFAGQLSSNRDSQFVFVVPSEGTRVMQLAAGLFDIVGLAYSQSGQLYAVDLAWGDKQAGGVYRLDDARLDGHSACRAVKIANIVRPTSLVFSDETTLYVTSLGSKPNAKSGQITKITGAF